MQVGDTVKVIKCNQYKNKYTGEIGEIVREYKEMFGVVLNGRTNHKSSYGCFWFKKVQVEQILNSLEDSEDFLIMNMTGFKYAKVSFMDNGNSVCSQIYALYDEDIVKGDVVVVKTGHHGLAVAKVEEVSETGQTPRNGREIVCKVDLAAYEARKEKQKRLAELQATMNARVKELQALAVYEMLSEKDEGMKALLDEFKKLSN